MTRHIKALEEKLGTRLFDRNTHVVSPTNAGRLFLEDARAILRHLDRASETVRRARQGETVRLRLAFVGALLDEKLIRLMQKYREIHPGCQLEMADLSPAAQLAAIRGGEIDGGFIGAKPARIIKGLILVAWKQEPLVLVLPERHPLAKIRSLRWPHLQGLAWVMVSQQAAPAFRRQFSDLVEKHSLSAQIVQESDRVPAVLTMVAAGNGVTMVPQATEHLINHGVVFRKLPLPPPVLHHTFAHRQNQVSAALANFLTLLG